MPLLGSGALLEILGRAWIEGGLLAMAGEGPPSVHETDGVPVIMGAILGAFAGLVVGFVLARLLQFLAYLFGKDFEGKGLIVICTIAGAVGMAWFAAKHG